MDLKERFSNTPAACGAEKNQRTIRITVMAMPFVLGRDGLARQAAEGPLNHLEPGGSCHLQGRVKLFPEARHDWKDVLIRYTGLVSGYDVLVAVTVLMADSGQELQLNSLAPVLAVVFCPHWKKDFEKVLSPAPIVHVRRHDNRHWFLAHLRLPESAGHQHN